MIEVKLLEVTIYIILIFILDLEDNIISILRDTNGFIIIANSPACLRFFNFYRLKEVCCKINVNCIIAEKC